MSEREFDFIIFGGTGITGKCVLRNLVKELELEKRPRWIAIVGSNKTQLKMAVTEIAIQMDRNLNDVDLIVADFNDEASLLSLCARTKVLLNAYDPCNTLLREKLAKACIEKRTHMLDISDDPEFIELIQFKYHEAAKASGVYLICSVNFNCVPIDIGVDYLKQQFLPAGRLHSVESYFSFTRNNHRYHPQLNSFVVNPILQSSYLNNSMLTYHNNADIKPSQLSQWITSSTSSTDANSLRSNKELSAWSIPIATNKVIWKSQKWFYEAYREPPIRFEQHLVVSQWHQLIFIVLSLIYLTSLSWFSFSRKLLSNYPDLLTFGFLSNSNNDRKEVKQSLDNNNNSSSLTSLTTSPPSSTPSPSSSSSSSSFSIHLVGQGWDSPSDSSDGQYKFPPNKTIRVSINGSKSDCETTSLILIQSGLTILEESSSMPYKGGCLTPAFAFRYTSIRDRLHQKGLQFKILHH
uniref:Saccharopine dehydrogenase NADP binding domain-containing protein n=1 Tax=Tetranychus urticae TaxID=32264 RepID=T1KBF5_TETUR